MISLGILSGMANTVGITAFSGTQPSAAQILANWTTYAAQILVHWSGVTYTRPLDGVLMTMGTPAPSPATATGTGTATWGLIWTTNVMPSDLNNGTIPSTQFMVVPVSLTLDDGVVRLATTTINTGDSVQLLDTSITAL